MVLFILFLKVINLQNEILDSSVILILCTLGSERVKLCHSSEVSNDPDSH